MRAHIFWGLILGTSLLHGANPEAASASFREVRLHVEDVQGKPAAHREVDLVGLERFSLEPDANGEKENQTWHFRTNEKGNISLSIGDFAGWLTGEMRPGWGVYALVVRRGSGDAGGVSSRFWFDNDNSLTHHYDPRKESWAPEWGEIRDLPPRGLDLKISIKDGFTLRGRIVDDQNPGVPLGEVGVSSNNDLHADTHTGLGGAILWDSAKTNAAGNFVLRHQFPQPLTLTISAVWLKTKVSGSWVDDVLDTVPPPARGGDTQIEIGAAKKPRFRYFGRVTDALGNPVGGVKVMARVSHHPTPSTFQDDHQSEDEGVTKSDGGYEFVAETPWVQRLDARAPNGRETSALTDLPDSSGLPPGKYDMSFDAQ